MKVRFTTGASRQLGKAMSCLEAESPRGAANPVEQLSEALARLRVFSQSGHLADEPDVRVLYIRRTPYALFYRLDDDQVSIVRIRHTSRRPLSRR